MKVLYFIIVIFVLSIFFILDADAQTYKMYVQKMPQSWQKQFGTVLDKAVQYWQEKIPGLKLESTSRQDSADFVLEWASQYDSGKLGYYTSSTINEYGKPKLTITLGYFKNKKWNLVSPEYALEITKHELGHAIGFTHSDDPNDIMYPKIESYESWLQTKTPPKIKTTNQTKSGDWKTQATKLQTLSDKKLFTSKTTLQQMTSLLNSTWTTNKASQAEMSKAINSFLIAKKFLNDAELLKDDADASFYESKYEDSYYKYQSSLDRAKKIDYKLNEIKKSLKKVDELEFGKTK
ncbi:MAG: M57 family metalloprotease [Candidatus Nitrosotenuis sp.]